MNIPKSRFYIDYGPSSLFERVKYKFEGIEELRTHARHFNERLEERKIPEYVINAINTFRTQSWRLVMAEVRNDTGKFINSTWEIEYEGVKYWLVIGFGSTIETIIAKDKGFHPVNEIIKEGEFFNFVADVNTELMRSDLKKKEAKPNQLLNYHEALMLMDNEIDSIPSDEDKRLLLISRIKELYITRAHRDLDFIKERCQIPPETFKSVLKERRGVSRELLAKLVVGLEIDLETAEMLFSLQSHPLQISSSRGDAIIASAIKNKDKIETFLRAYYYNT